MRLLLKYGKYVFLTGIVLVLIANSLSCITIYKDKIPSSGKKDTTTVPTVSSKTRPHPPVRTGEITLGTRKELSSQSIGKAGGNITIAKPGEPLDGFIISVPPESYSASRTFKVSSAPITKHTFGSDINPISPMIIVDNGGAYSEKSCMCGCQSGFLRTILPWDLSMMIRAASLRASRW